MLDAEVCETIDDLIAQHGSGLEIREKSPVKLGLNDVTWMTMKKEGIKFKGHLLVQTRINGEHADFDLQPDQNARIDFSVEGDKLIVIVTRKSGERMQYEFSHLNLSKMEQKALD